MDNSDIGRLALFFNRFFKSVRLTENTPFLCKSNNTDTIDVYLSERYAGVSQILSFNFSPIIFRICLRYNYSFVKINQSLIIFDRRK